MSPKGRGRYSRLSPIFMGALIFALTVCSSVPVNAQCTYDASSAFELTKDSGNWFRLDIPGLKSSVWDLLKLVSTSGATKTVIPIRMCNSPNISQCLCGDNGKQIRITMRVTGGQLHWDVNDLPVDPPKAGSDPVPEKPQETDAFLTDKEQEMLDLLNGERVRAGLSPLVADEDLTLLARLKSRDMIDLGYFAHTSPTYGSPFDMMKGAGVQYMMAAENLAGAPTVDRAHTGLMNSEGHRRNILTPEFKRVGIGIIEGGSYGLMVTQLFVG